MFPQHRGPFGCTPTVIHESPVVVKMGVVKVGEVPEKNGIRRVTHVGDNVANLRVIVHEICPVRSNRFKGLYSYSDTTHLLRVLYTRSDPATTTMGTAAHVRVPRHVYFLTILVGDCRAERCFRCFALVRRQRWPHRLTGDRLHLRC